MTSDNAERLVKAYGEDLRFCTDYGKWLFWDETRWLIDDKAQTRVMRCAKRMVRNIYLEAGNETDDGKRKELVRHAKESESEQRLKAAVSLARSEPGVPIAVKGLDSDPLLLNCSNSAPSNFLTPFANFALAP